LFGANEIVHRDIERVVHYIVKFAWAERVDPGELKDHALRTFPILQEKLSTKAGDLSGGQQKQLEFSRFLCGKTKYAPVALCAMNISDEGIAQLRVALDRFGEAARKVDPYQRVEATTEFYGVILKYSGNPVIEESLMRLLARVNFLRARSMSVEGRARQSHIEMAAIFDAIKKRDHKAARVAAETHVFQARETARRSYFAEGGTSPSSHETQA
jgi:DNA-binding FadR family transcriptional regulator